MEMGYSNANLIGLIEIDSDLRFNLSNDADETQLAQTLARLAGNDLEMRGILLADHSDRLSDATVRTPLNNMQWARADVDHLQVELELSFHDLIGRLLEGE